MGSHISELLKLTTFLPSDMISIIFLEYCFGGQKRAGTVFVRTPFKAPWHGIVFFMKIIADVFLSNLFAPWQETFADARGGDKRGQFGTIWDHGKSIWDSF